MEYSLSFIPEDQLIVLNNVAYTSDTFKPISTEHTNIRALHWTPNYKHVEYTDGTYKELSTEEEYNKLVFPYVLKANEYINLKAKQPLDTNNEELCAKNIRAVRNRLLKDTDYVMLEDSQVSPEMLTKVKAYRQSLRDITKKAGFPWTGTPTANIPWPKNPLEEVVN